MYAHNLSGFDGIFLMKHLLSYGKVEPLLHNGKIISITVKLNIVGYMNKTIVFKDSYLLLPLGLRMLCKAFNISVSKGYFPFKLTNILYKGLFPKFEYWTGITLSEYNNLLTKYTGQVWSFKDESIKYCKLDCISLHEVLIKFTELIYSEFNINSHKSLTLPSLAMRIYKSQFMPENSVYQIVGPIERDIRQSYSGGAVDVFIPHNRITNLFNKIKALFVKLYQYDANSLYPTVMAIHPMPIGKPIAFTGDIRKIDVNAFGFFYCNITSPEFIEHPILQRRIETSEGIRTIAGLGSWSGWICSNEMDKAIKLGYQFEIIKGYQFETGDIFSGYINKLYNLRLEYAKGHPMNLIAKLLMNSLYGKFGMKLEITKVEMFDCSDDEGVNYFRAALDLYGTTVQDYVKLDDTFVIIRNALADILYNEELDMYHGQDVNIAIASTITAGARIYMSAFKNRSNFKLYYSDTDSIVIDAQLPVELIGNNLGQFKLEQVIERAVFLAPKVYGYITAACEAGTGSEVIKIKGIKDVSELHIADMEALLIKDSIREFTQEKWYKKVIEGNINIQDIAYTPLAR